MEVGFLMVMWRRIEFSLWSDFGNEGICLTILPSVGEARLAVPS